MDNKKDEFTSKLGFVLAAAGSAVGLGNIWRFPYLAAKYGGGIFLLTYIIVILTFGNSLMISENTLGRITRKGPIGAFRAICANQSSFLKFIRFGGYINAVVPLLILPYYCVIGGWVTKYFVMMFYTSINSFTRETAVSYFTNFITNPWDSALYFVIFAAITAGIVAWGVEKGIERSSKMLMPLLLLLCIGLCIYCCFLPNASEGIRYYLKPNWDDFSYMTIVAAIGQAFFSLSLAMGISITYGSYMRKEDNILSSVNQVQCFDTSVAILAGLMIIPAVVSFGGKEAAREAGPSLVFVTLPQVFATFKGGQIVGIFFFLLILFAAATSAISILETNVQTISQEFKITRKKSIVITMLECCIIGGITLLGYSVLDHIHPLGFIPYCKDKKILDTLDFLSNNLIMPLAAVFLSVLVTCVIGLEKFCKDIQGQNKWPRKFAYQLIMCLLVIPCLLIVLLDSLGIIQ